MYFSSAQHNGYRLLLRFGWQEEIIDCGQMAITFSLAYAPVQLAGRNNSVGLQYDLNIVWIQVTKYNLFLAI